MENKDGRGKIIEHPCTADSQHFIQCHFVKTLMRCHRNLLTCLYQELKFVSLRLLVFWGQSFVLFFLTLCFVLLNSLKLTESVQDIKWVLTVHSFGHSKGRPTAISTSFAFLRPVGKISRRLNRSLPHQDTGFFKEGVKWISSLCLMAVIHVSCLWSSFKVLYFFIDQREKHQLVAYNTRPDSGLPTNWTWATLARAVVLIVKESKNYSHIETWNHLLQWFQVLEVSEISSRYSLSYWGQSVYLSTVIQHGIRKTWSL